MKMLRSFIGAMVPFVALAIIFPATMFGIYKVAYWMVYEQPTPSRGPQEIIGRNYIDKLYKNKRWQKRDSLLKTQKKKSPH